MNEHEPGSEQDEAVEREFELVQSISSWGDDEQPGESDIDTEGLWERIRGHLPDPPKRTESARKHSDDDDPPFIVDEQIARMKEAMEVDEKLEQSLRDHSELRRRLYRKVIEDDHL